MKKVYIVLTYSGTLLSKIVKIYTKDQFSHVSISLDEHLDNMYSFGRKHPYNPIWAGFVKEKPNVGTFKRFKDTTTEIYSLEIEDEKYEIIKNIIEDMKIDKNSYKFNIVGLLAVSLHQRIKRKRAFYCAEFVKYLLDESNYKTNLPDIIKPEDFKSIENIKLVYNGKLNNYN